MPGARRNIAIRKERPHLFFDPGFEHQGVIDSVTVVCGATVCNKLSPGTDK